MGYGPRYVQEKLREQGIPRERWEDALDALPEAAEQIGRFLEGKLRGRAPEEAEKRRLSAALARRGFSWGEIKAAWSRYGVEFSSEE